ncbi:hypothetical protein C8R46DRAFT_1215314 [Mycena filopes]|nr:hypothetical protein C8R46DRAFT_1215314 [Mycena filopes]
MIRDFNVPISKEELCCSFTQYTTGGLFYFVRNSFKTEVLEMTATKSEKQAWVQEAKTWWEDEILNVSERQQPSRWKDIGAKSRNQLMKSVECASSDVRQTVNTERSSNARNLLQSTECEQRTYLNSYVSLLTKFNSYCLAGVKIKVSEFEEEKKKEEQAEQEEQQRWCGPPEGSTKSKKGVYVK